jgi:Zn-dependent protease/thioredoxin-like negative regulator of GroEL
MRFSLFGIPTEVQFSFLFGSIMLGLHDVAFLPYWVVIVFVSVLTHELGHAFAIRGFGMHPEISLQWLGGLTSWSGGRDLPRWKRIAISFAGPFGGFVLAAALYFGLRGRALPMTLGRVVDTAMLVNVAWGIVNLAPVLPLDGGHILEHALGPKRSKTTALVSMVCGGAIAVYGFMSGNSFLGFLFAMCALQSFQRWQAEGATPAPRKFATRPVEAPMSPPQERALKRASDALAEERFDEAREQAKAVLAMEPPRSGRIRALEIVAWTFLLEGALDEATKAVRAIEKHGHSDAALAGGLLFARGDVGAARAVFEAARSVGDDRKEVVGPLIQILLAEGEVARAAAVALDIVDSLSDEDVRRMADIAAEKKAFGWSARLHEALFTRTQGADDAFAAARAKSLEGDASAAVELLKKAQRSGFADAARVWRDPAFEALAAARGEELANLFPKP